MRNSFEFLPHTADVKFVAYGSSLESCFKGAFMALKDVMFKELKARPVLKREIKIKGTDLENLLYNFLEEFLYLLDSEKFVSLKIKKIKINKDDFSLVTEVLGDSVKNYKIYNPVKAVTYHDMFVRKEKDGFVCQVVVDV